MPKEQTIESGGEKYYVVERGDLLIVERGGWLRRHCIGKVHNLEEAYGLIKMDSGSRNIQIR